MSLANEKYLVPEEQKIKHLLPVPREMTVMLECEDEGGGMHWRDYRETPYAVCLATVVEVYNGKKREVIRPYNLTGSEIVNDNSLIIQLQYCPKCGKEMKPHMTGYEIQDVSFSCACGAELAEWDNDWLKESGV